MTAVCGNTVHEPVHRSGFDMILDRYPRSLLPRGISDKRGISTALTVACTSFYVYWGLLGGFNQFSVWILCSSSILSLRSFTIGSSRESQLSTLVR